jgi:hypothetical protein
MDAGHARLPAQAEARGELFDLIASRAGKTARVLLRYLKGHERRESHARYRYRFPKLEARYLRL